MKIVEVIKKIAAAVGGVSKHVFGVIESLVGDQEMTAAIVFVEAAAEREIDNAEKSQWVQKKLQNRFPGLSDTMATLITHAALVLVKREVKALAEKAAADVSEPAAK